MDVGHLIKNMPSKHNYTHIRAGDTVKVYYRVVEGERQRTQQIQGVVMWMTRNGANANITIRRVIDGVGVERTFLLNSPRLENIEVIRQGKVRRARLFYQRGRTGRRARIKEGTKDRSFIQREDYLDSNPEPSVEAATAISDNNLDVQKSDETTNETENILSPDLDTEISSDSKDGETDDHKNVTDVSSEDEEDGDVTKLSDESVPEEDSKE
jgi:large subunit ribosomal protein L19